MKILSIETSCDETAIAVIEASGDLNSPHFTVLGSALFSQIAIHKEYGGVFPTLAKREHAKNLPPLLSEALKKSNVVFESPTTFLEDAWQQVEQITARENNLYSGLREYLEKISIPDIDVIAVTSGPGLEPALWVGISCAQALSVLWNKPVIGINHMEGHIASVLRKNDNTVQFPALALLISGGHTELVLIQSWGQYKIIGQTRDDAVGEAFDKVARLLDLPYPGGPEISKLAVEARENNIEHSVSLPRPMIHSHNLDFSFSGLKTAVLYWIRDHGPISEAVKKDLAREFEDSVIEVLIHKTKEALNSSDFKTLIIAGGVIANKTLREKFENLTNEFPSLSVKIPDRNLATDNAIMIAFAAYLNILLYPEILKSNQKIIAHGNLQLSQKS